MLKGDRILIPKVMQPDMIKRIHAGHQGAEKCKLRAKSCVFWHNINKDLDDVVNQCNICQEHQRKQTRETLQPHEVPEFPWQILGADLFYLDGTNYILIMDYYSKFPIVRELPNNTTSATIVRLMKQIFSEHGVPQSIVSDNGPQFQSAIFKEFTQEWMIQHRTSSPRYPQSNGFAERGVQSIKSALKKAKASGMDREMALLCLRTTPIDHMLPSPAELLFNRKFLSNLPMRRNDPSNKEEIRSRLKERQVKQKHYHDKGAKDLPPLTTGQHVRLLNDNNGHWEPAIIKAPYPEPRFYLVETDDGSVLRRNRSHLRDAPNVCSRHIRTR